MRYRPKRMRIPAWLEKTATRGRIYTRDAWVTTMNLGIIILAFCLVPALVVGSVLLWVGTDAMLHGRGTRDAALAIFGQALRSIYDDTARQSLPDDFVDMLGKLTEHRQPAANT